MKPPRNIELKARITADEFIPFLAECEADGISQSAAIRNMIRNRTAHRNGTCRRVRPEVPNQGRSGPSWGMFAPGRGGYGGQQIRMRV